MAMRRGVHTSRVLKALGTANRDATAKPAKIAPPPKLSRAEMIPNEFPNVHQEEE
jgi:acetolactate synthase-1/3 small subunit